jgi:hypothetical protein
VYVCMYGYVWGISAFNEKGVYTLSIYVYIHTTRRIHPSDMYLNMYVCIHTYINMCMHAHKARMVIENMCFSIYYAHVCTYMHNAESTLTRSEIICASAYTMHMHVCTCTQRYMYTHAIRDHMCFGIYYAHVCTYMHSAKSIHIRSYIMCIWLFVLVYTYTHK